jgi:hypothetical protein
MRLRVAMQVGNSKHNEVAPALLLAIHSTHTVIDKLTVHGEHRMCWYEYKRGSVYACKRGLQMLITAQHIIS